MLEFEQLFCEYSINPVGIDEPYPRFSWNFKQNQAGIFQVAYQVIVSSTRKKIQQDRGDIWDSGRVRSDSMTNIAYNGKKLISCKKYYWKARVWSNEMSGYTESRIAHFQMGLLELSDWKGYWICSPYSDRKNCPLFRKEFEIHKKIQNAALHVSGLGYYELHLNGKRAGDYVLDPGWTDYNRSCFYTTYDVTDLLKQGVNCIGLILGNGRYVPSEEKLERSLFSLKEYGDKPVFILQLKIELDDGETANIYSDTSWKTEKSPVLSSDIYDGETYDSRFERSGWDIPGHNDNDWENARKAKTPKGVLKSQASFPKIRVCKTIKPRKVFNIQENVNVYDFGQNFSGWVRIKARGKAGWQIKLRHSELQNRDGSLNTGTNISAKATDIYIFKDSNSVEYEPKFTYHGFRYVEITGDPGLPEVIEILGCFVHTDVEPVGKFKCSDKFINKLHRNITWGQLSNLMSVPTDSPQRAERLGWLGDSQLTAEESIFNFNMPGFFTKWIENMIDAQREDGSLSDVVPAYWELYPADPAWGTACVLIPWLMYVYYGDVRILQRSYDMIKKWVDFLKSVSKNYIVAYGNYGDWCPPRHVISLDTPLSLTSTWYFYHDTMLVTKISKILGYRNESKKYRSLSERIKKAFNQKFLKDDYYTGQSYDWYGKQRILNVDSEEKEKIVKGFISIFGKKCQTSNSLPLYLDMVPVGRKEKVIQSLIRDIESTHDNHINTGIVGTRYILDVLSKIGFSDLAYKVITQRTYPGWGYMIKEGATTLWERWDYVSGSNMNSHNHIMFGSVDAWFYKFLTGINYDEKNPGFKKIIIEPLFISEISFAYSEFNSLRGTIKSGWVRENDTIQLNITIPPNSCADLRVKKIYFKNFSIKSGNNTVWHNSYFNKATGIVDGKEDNKYIILELYPGSYELFVKKANF